MSQKYIRVKVFQEVENIVLTFPSIIDHSRFARNLGLVSEDIVSAGFFCIKVSDMANPIYHCYGRSVSLDKDSMEDDSKYLNYQMYDTFDETSY